jgi:hypothetical protein
VKNNFIYKKSLGSICEEHTVSIFGVNKELSMIPASLLVDPEDRGSMFFRNISEHLPDYMAL